jgi:glycosyltransferase involved in cell wall biosynthesis
VKRAPRRLAMILKGYPRISESFISAEILLLESLGLEIEICSLRQPRESFTHEHVKHIKAPVTYTPEYVLPHCRTLARANRALFGRLGSHYARCLRGALKRAAQRRDPATVRHFLQAGYLSQTCLSKPSIAHIHAHFCHTPASVALFASELLGVPFSFTAHAKDIYTSEPDQLARKISRARFVVTCTRYNAQYLRRLSDALGCTTPIHTIYHGIDTRLFHPEGPPPPGPPFRILSVGRLVEKKGYDDLLEALGILERQGVDFEFFHIGSGELEWPLRSMVEKRRLAHRVTMLGTRPHSEVLAHYGKAHCFALACKVAPNGDRDGIPNVLVEAMATGLPVVATRVSAIPELVQDGLTGTLVAPQDPKALAAALKDVLAFPSKYKPLADAARVHVERNFDSHRCVRDLHRLFAQVLENP